MIEVGDLLKLKKQLIFGSVNGTIPEDELFLVIPAPPELIGHADYVWVEPLITEGVPHQICLDYVEKVE